MHGFDSRAALVVIDNNVKHTNPIKCSGPIGSELKTGRREEPNSIASRACRLNRSEFSVVFSETRENTG